MTNEGIFMQIKDIEIEINISFYSHPIYVTWIYV